MNLIIATKNPGKIEEIRRLLTGLPIEVGYLGDFTEVEKVAETGSTFHENARLKASGYALQTGSYTLADDSGLEIAALGGAPGVLSARYGGENTGYPEKMELVLSKLAETPEAETLGNAHSQRRARFICVMAVASPEGEILHEAEGICDGKIAPGPRGTSGFGYDPIFIPDGFSGTFGELGDDIKQQISHRARAISEIMRFLLDFTHI
ncbi:MAG TPA: RdgB/HAM1 family non-canonical purine NTP pyrophosphatase [Pyrinomonadaceae bacterium]|jgi:XTP/dITP diphosphohydrolase|nr:RdgB/HAM1 family non-canonical purine NTP pyrophosphatase [Pyrinomonadaceae bacterium]